MHETVIAVSALRAFPLFLDITGPDGPGKGCISPFGLESQMAIHISPIFPLAEILNGVARRDSQIRNNSNW